MSELVRLAHPASTAEWRERARELLRRGVPPEQVHWVGDGVESLFAPVPAVEASGVEPVPAPRVPKRFLALAEPVLAHRDRQRHALLYRLLWRLTHGEPKLLEVTTDLDVARARSWERAVEQDVHRMHAFVRFRALHEEGHAPVYVAWFEPEHHIVERAAPFFVRRFAGMQWAILTPERSVHWDGAALSFGPGAARGDAPTGDALEALWRTYYASIFNPARLNVGLMKSHMPVRYWKNLPEARLIPELAGEASAVAHAMLARPASVPRKRVPAPDRRLETDPDAGTLEALRRDIHDCRRCPLWEPATQAVCGEGPAKARVMLIGEQPGDREDLAGRPFVGPAGEVLDAALEEAGIARNEVYVTNAVKHFKFEPRGKRRLHQTASAREQSACLPLLEREMELVDPDVVVCLGAVATRAVLGRSARVGTARGRWHALPDGREAFVTVHPAALLRLPDASAYAEEFSRFVDDLRKVSAHTRRTATA